MRPRAGLALALLVAAPAAAQSFLRTEILDRNGNPRCLYWSNRNITWNADAAGNSQTPGTSEFVAIEAAFATWQALSNSCSDFVFTQGPQLTNPSVGRGTQANNVVTFRELSCTAVVPSSDPCQADGSCSNKFRCWDHGDLTIALTTNTYSVSTAVIVDSDIELNSAPQAGGRRFLFTTVSAPPCDEGAEAVTCVATDVQNTMTHEIGHLVGLDHVDDELSTMAPTAPVGDLQKRVVDRGSADGFCLTYPRSLPAASCDELASARRKIVATNVGTAVGCGHAKGLLPPAPLGLLGLLGLGVAGTRLRRRRSR